MSGGRRRRGGSIDFQSGGAAGAAQSEGTVVTSGGIVLPGVVSSPPQATAAEAFLKGKRLDEEAIDQAAELAARPAKPLDNADLAHFWRKRMVRVVVEQPLHRISDQGAGFDG